MRHFNPRAPCGARPHDLTADGFTILFQSTRPVRGATEAGGNTLIMGDISIHAPRAGRDNTIWRPGWYQFRFQSTRPVRGATRGSYTISATFIISIHAPRAGRDDGRGRCPAPIFYFNPRAPCGARPRCRATLVSWARFQSTRPVRGATGKPALCKSGHTIFQSTRPVRGATECTPIVDGRTDISIHAPRAGRDDARFTWPAGYDISIHAPRAGRDWAGDGWQDNGQKISIHAPRAGRDFAALGDTITNEVFQSTRPVRGATAKVYKITLHTFATKGNF